MPLARSSSKRVSGNPKVDRSVFETITGTDNNITLTGCFHGTRRRRPARIRVAERELEIGGKS